MFPNWWPKTKDGRTARAFAVGFAWHCDGRILPIAAYNGWLVTILFGEVFGDRRTALVMRSSTSLYACMANVVVKYRLSLGMGRETSLPLPQGLRRSWGSSSSLAQVVYVQVALMAAFVPR